MNEVRQLAGDGGVGSPFSVFHDVQVNPKGARMNGARMNGARNGFVFDI